MKMWQIVVSAVASGVILYFVFTALFQKKTDA